MPPPHLSTALREPAMLRTVAWRSTRALARRTPLFGAIRACSSLPSHELMPLPALSPTMSTGTITEWYKEEGDAIVPGDVVCGVRGRRAAGERCRSRPPCSLRRRSRPAAAHPRCFPPPQVETDKASVDYEAQDEGVLAKILAPAGTADLGIGTPIAVLVYDEDDVAAFSDYKVEQAPTPSPSAEPAPAPAAPPAPAPPAPAPAPAAPAAAPTPSPAPAPAPAAPAPSPEPVPEAPKRRSRGPLSALCVAHPCPLLSTHTLCPCLHPIYPPSLSLLP